MSEYASLKLPVNSRLYGLLLLKALVHTFILVSPTKETGSFCLTWSGLAGHGVLLDVRTNAVCIIRRLVDPPVRPLPKQNPEEDNSDTHPGCSLLKHVGAI